MIFIIKLFNYYGNHRNVFKKGNKLEDTAVLCL